MTRRATAHAQTLQMSGEAGLELEISAASYADLFLLAEPLIITSAITCDNHESRQRTVTRSFER